MELNHLWGIARTHVQRNAPIPGKHAVPAPTSEQLCRMELFSARCTVFTQFPIRQESEPYPLPLPNRFAKSSRSVLAARFFTQFPI